MGEIRKGKLSILKSVQDIPVEREPFKGIAKNLKIDEEEVVYTIKNLMERGVVRRFSAVLNHRSVGITANAMVCWGVPSSKVDSIGKKLAQFKEVTHCYERPWDYNMFMMIHGKTREEVIDKIKRISESVKIADYKVLFSTRQLKRTSFRL